MSQPSTSLIKDKKINLVLEKLHSRAGRETPSIVLHVIVETLKGLIGLKNFDPKFVRDKLIPISRDQGDLIYMLCRSLQAKRVVEFGTSFGVSTLYLAASVRDNGGGVVIGTEIEQEKARHARSNFSEAGVADLVDLREGDATITLRDCGGPVDFLLMDGFPKFALPIIKLMTPQLRRGAIVLCDNIGHMPGYEDYVSFIRDPQNGFISIRSPLRGGTEFSVKIK